MTFGEVLLEGWVRALGLQAGSWGLAIVHQGEQHVFQVCVSDTWH